MPGLAETLASLSKFQGTFRPTRSADASRLVRLTFAPNPGNLDGYRYVPDGLPAGSPLVVVLHGCTQTAAGYDNGSGWSRLAERSGFAVLFPEQRQENNQNRCFNWFSQADTTRGGGEVFSIATMIRAMVDAHALDPARVFITGLSAGGAMAGAMLATYPDLFAGGTIIAGLPYGVAHSVSEAFQAMGGQRPASRDVLGNIVREAKPGTANWPRVAVWHGTADRTVAPVNGNAVVAQWLDVHGLSDTPTRTESVDGQTRSVWSGPGESPLVEFFSVAGLAHGTPLNVAVNPDEAAGPFMLDAGISSTLHSARSWGIGPGETSPLPEAQQNPQSASARKPFPNGDAPLEGSATAPATKRRATSIDVGQVINDALRSAGLLR